MKKILVVDDEPDIRETIKAILESRGYEVVSASNADECLAMVRREMPDLILLDIMMPGTPVSEVVKQIKDVKIVFMSVVRISEARKNGLTAQANIIDFIQKPFDVGDLIGRIELILGE